MAQSPINYTRFVAVTPSDTVNIGPTSERAGTGERPDALYVGGAGNLVAVMPDGSTATFTGVTAGTILPIRPSRVNATSTTATAILALYQV